jgi:hypothetical protein
MNRNNNATTFRTFEEARDHARMVNREQGIRVFVIGLPGDRYAVSTDIADAFIASVRASS